MDDDLKAELERLRALLRQAWLHIPPRMEYVELLDQIREVLEDKGERE